MSFDGTWDLRITTPIGEQPVRLVIVENEGEVSGSATSANETVPLLEPVREGDRLRWSQRVTRPMPLTVAFDVALLAEGEFEGTARAGLFPRSRAVGSRIDGAENA